MLGSLVLYAGLAVALVGAIATLRPLRSLYLSTRRQGASVFVLGFALCALAALLPAPAMSVETLTSLLDEFIPVWQFDEHHEILIDADPARVERAVREVTAREIRLVRLLTWLRRPRVRALSGPGDILAPSPDLPILEVALSSGFLLLAEVPEREVVFGTFVVAPPEARRLPRAASGEQPAGWTPARFRDLSEPGYAKAVMNFRIAAESDGRTRLTTETRVFATDAATARRFAVYWRLIYPGSSLIRRMWLKAIRERAQSDVSAISERSLAVLARGLRAGGGGRVRGLKEELARRGQGR